jgi:hypothetical protein
MNDQENKTKGDHLGDFLRKAGKGQLEDDFEREAAEGFSMLEPGEAHELKAQTDRRVASLFSYGKRKQAVQWSIAAGVVLVISMTVYFLRPEVSSDHSRVVQNDISEKKEEVMPRTVPAPETEKAARIEEKPAPKNKSEAPPSPAMGKQAEAALAAEAEATGEDAGKTETITPEQTVELTAAGKPEEQAMPPARADETSRIAAGYAADKVAVQSAPSERSKDAPSKKHARAASEPAPAAARESADTYDPGGSQLNLILRKKLQPKVETAFSAIVTINEGVVKNVDFISNGLSKSEKKEIGKTLRELTAEELRPTGVTNGEIKLDYRP